MAVEKISQSSRNKWSLDLATGPIRAETGPAAI